MWYGRPASPASSTSTVDQQEIILDDSVSSPGQIIYMPQGNATTIIVGPSIPNNHLNLNHAHSNHLHHINNIHNNHHHYTNHVPASSSSSSTINNHLPNNVHHNNHRKGNQNNLNNINSNNNNAPQSTSSSKSPQKRPKLFSSQQQVAPWKALQHHFLRHSDVKSKREKRMTMAELNSEVLRRRNGWKVHHLVGQLSDLIQIEEQTRGRLDRLLKLFISDGAQRIHDLAKNCHKLPEQYATLLQSQRSYGVNEFNSELIVSKIDDLLRGDLQRSNIFDEQLSDSRDLVVRITNEHRDRVGVITAKFNKRIQL